MIKVIYLKNKLKNFLHRQLSTILQPKVFHCIQSMFSFENLSDFDHRQRVYLNHKEKILINYLF